MRLFSRDRYPFLNLVRDPKSTTSVSAAFQDALKWWWVVRAYMVTVTWHIDPATSESGSSTYTRSLLLERLFHDTSNLRDEHTLVFPGAETDILHPYGIGGTEAVPNFGDAIYSAFHCVSELVVTGEDDVFQSTSLSATLDLFDGGYSVNPETGVTAVSIKLRVHMSYDDGTEGALKVQTFPTDDPEDDYYKLAATGEIEGSSFAVEVGDTATVAGPSAYLQGTPDVELVPVLWWTYSKKDASGPIWDGLTGELIGNPFETAQ